MSKTIVILGGSYTGLSIAHGLLKKTRTTVDIKVILVNPSDHFFWNMATVRAIIPGLFPDDQLHYNIPQGFATTYGEKEFEFVLGTADAVDVTAKLVSISTASGLKKLAYDHLVIATGSNTLSKSPMKANGLTKAELEKKLAELQDQVAKAKSIVVGGAGVTGVETIAELGFEYRTKKEITLINAGTTILEGSCLTAAQIKNAQGEIEKLDVKIVHETRVLSVKTVASGETELTLSTGGTMLTDLYIPTVGLIANSNFLPKDFLDDKGEITVDKYLHTKVTEDIWAAGDVSGLQRSGIMIAKTQAGHLVKNLDLTLRGQAPEAFKLPEKDTIFITLGRSKGTASLNGWKIPSLAVWAIKGRNFMVGTAKDYTDGTSV